MKTNNHPSADFDHLLAQAQNIRKKAHAPYSKFKVGACIRADNGKFYTGCNIENAAYPLGICSEASAICAMISDGAHRIDEIVIIGSSDKFCSPCGGCRQRIREFATEQLKITMCNQNGDSKTMTLAELLPESFGPEHLEA